MVMNNLEEIFKASSVFKDKSKLSPDYIPNNLPHRENKIKEMGLAFREIVTNPGKVSIRLVIAGRTGTGKTAVAKVFGMKFTEIAKSRGIRVEYIHLNCHRDRTLYLLISEAAMQLKLPLPYRGLSSHEILKAIHEYLERRNAYLIMTLDEFDYFLDTAPIDDIYFLVRIYDELPFLTPRINYIFIVRELSKIRSLDPVIRDHIARQIIEFPPYNSNELYDILQDRVKIAFNENSVMEEVIRYISDTHGYDKGGTGNARAAIETLELAGEIADKYGSPIVTLEYAKEANSRLNPHITEVIDNIRYLELHPLLILKAVISILKRKNTEYATMGEVEEEYNRICEELGENARRHTQVYEYVRRMKQMGILNSMQSGKGLRGRTTLISLTVPITLELEELINKEIRGRIVSKT